MAACVYDRNCVAKSCAWTCCVLWAPIACVFMANSILIVVALFNYSAFSESNNCSVLSDITRPHSGNAPIIMTHRGYIDEYPENTLEAIIASYELGYAAEFDILMTKDKVPVVVHDEHLLESTSEDIYVSDSDWSTLSQIKYLDTIHNVTYNGTFSIVQLSEVLDAICTQFNDTDIVAYLDMKFSVEFGGMVPALFMTTVDEMEVDRMIDVMAESPCADLPTFTFLCGSYNVAALNYMTEKWNYSLSAYVPSE